MIRLANRCTFGFNLSFITNVVINGAFNVKINPHEWRHTNKTNTDRYRRSSPINYIWFYKIYNLIIIKQSKMNQIIHKRQRIPMSSNQIEDYEIDDYVYTITYNQTNGSILRLRQSHIVDGIEQPIELEDLPLSTQFEINDAVKNHWHNYRASKEVKATINQFINVFKSFDYGN